MLGARFEQRGRTAGNDVRAAMAKAVRYGCGIKSSS